MRHFPKFFPLPFLILISGCAGFESAQLAVNERGPAQVFSSSPFQRDRTLVSQGVAVNQNLLGLFVDAYRMSFAHPYDTDPAYTMALTGYDLVDNYCYQFETLT